MFGNSIGLQTNIIGYSASCKSGFLDSRTCPFLLFSWLEFLQTMQGLLPQLLFQINTLIKPAICGILRRQEKSDLSHNLLTHPAHPQPAALFSLWHSEDAGTSCPQKCYQHNESWGENKSFHKLLLPAVNKNLSVKWTWRSFKVSARLQCGYKVGTHPQRLRTECVQSIFLQQTIYLASPVPWLL